MMRQWRAGTIHRTMANAAAACACTAALLAAADAAGQACPCAKRDLATVVERADVIFVGKPLAATTDGGRVGAQPAVDYQARFAFDVEVVLKGSTPRATTVVTPVGPCGYGFAVGGEYLVIGKRQDGVVVTDACQGNAAGTEAIRPRAAAIRAALAPAPAPTAASPAP